MTFDEKDWNTLKFFDATWKREAECEVTTDAEIKNAGQKAPNTFQGIERLLSYLDGVSSCCWGCPGGDHAIERLIFRSVNRGRAAIRLMRMGFYDESLTLARANGEIANLLSLFACDPATLEDWKKKEKWTTSPVEVRKAIEQRARMLPVGKERYGLLSAAVHADPDFAPAAYNILNVPVAAGIFFAEGMILCLNEISLPLVFVALASAELVQLPKDVRLALLRAGKYLISNTGSFTIEKQAEYWREQRDRLEKALDAHESTLNERPD